MIALKGGGACGVLNQVQPISNDRMIAFHSVTAPQKPTEPDDMREAEESTINTSG